MYILIFFNPLYIFVYSIYLSIYFIHIYLNLNPNPTNAIYLFLYIISFYLISSFSKYFPFSLRLTHTSSYSRLTHLPFRCPFSSLACWLPPLSEGFACCLPNDLCKWGATSSTSTLSSSSTLATLCPMEIRALPPHFPLLCSLSPYLYSYLSKFTYEGMYT